MRIAEVKRTPALFCAVFFILTAALLASGCAGTAVTETGTAGEKAAEQQSAAVEAKPGEVVVNDSDVVIKLKNDQITYGELKKMWSCTVGIDDPGQFDRLSRADQEQAFKQISVNHLSALKAKEKELHLDKFFRVREYELLTRLMPAVYAEKVIGAEINPTDQEILMASPPALPEVRVRIFVAKTGEVAQNVYKRILAGEDMDKLVRTESKGLSTGDGGLTKWLSVQNSDRFPQPVVQRFMDAEVGQVLEPFFQDVGHLVVKVEGKRTKEDVEQLWLKDNRDDEIFKRRKARYDERLAELMAKNDRVRYSPDLIENLNSGKPPAANQEIITIRDMSFTLETVIPELMKMGGKHGSDKLTSHVVKFIERAVITEEALASGIMLTPEVKEKIEIQSEKFLATILRKAVADEASNREVKDSDVWEYYEKNPAEFTEPRRICISLIEMKDLDKAAQVLEMAKGGSPFADLAKEHSANSSAEGGGVLGCYYEEDIPKVILEAVAPLGIGELYKEPLLVSVKAEENKETPNGEKVPDPQSWLLLRVDDVLNPALVPFDRVKRPVIEGRIKTHRRTIALNSLLNSLALEYGYENCFIKTGKENVSQ